MGASTTAILANETAATSLKLASQGLDLLAAAYPFTVATDCSVLVGTVTAIDATLTSDITPGDLTTGSSNTADLAVLNHLYESTLLAAKERRGSVRITEIAAYNAFSEEYGTVVP